MSIGTMTTAVDDGAGVVGWTTIAVDEGLTGVALDATGTVLDFLVQVLEMVAAVLDVIAASLYDTAAALDVTAATLKLIDVPTGYPGGVDSVSEVRPSSGLADRVGVP